MIAAAPAHRPIHGPITDLEHRKRLAEDITSLAAHIRAATARWLLMIAEFDRDKVWADWDCQSCAHWLMWRCGLSPTAARDHVRVANRLAEMPRTTEAFSKGELSYSQVRALSRIVAEANEEEILGMARTATAAQIERMAGAYRRVKSIEAAEAELEAERVRHATRYLRYHVDDDGSYVIKARLSPDDGALVVRALEAARTAVSPAENSAESPKDTPAENSAESPEQNLEAEIVDKVAETAAEMWERGEDRDSAEFFLRECGESNPTTRKNADALVVMAETLLEAGPVPRSGGDRNQLVVHVDIGALTTDDGGMCQLDEGVAIPPEVARRLGCDASIVTLIERDGEPLNLGRKTRTPSVAIRRALAARDKGCRFPGCGNRSFVDAHHMEHWFPLGETRMTNLLQLCRFHHRLVHEYGYQVELKKGVAIFTRPDGSRITSDPPSPAPEDTNVIEINERRGLEIDSETCVTGWCGDSMDLGDAVGALLWWDQQEDEQKQQEG